MVLTVPDFDGIMGSSFGVVLGDGSDSLGSVFLEAGKLPLPFKSQYRFTSGKVLTSFNTNSKLGLFLPESKWEMLERCTLILSAKTAADKS